jgi:hypothetical protein
MTYAYRSKFGTQTELPSDEALLNYIDSAINENPTQFTSSREDFLVSLKNAIQGQINYQQMSRQHFENERRREAMVAGRPHQLTRHDLILKLVSELTKKFKTQVEWLPIIEQIRAKPSLEPIKAMYPANIRKKAGRDLKLLDRQLQKTPKLVYLSLIDRVGHPDFEEALAATRKTSKLRYQ